MRIARSKCLPMPWTRAGGRLIPDGHSANRSLSAIDPVSATAKRKLENGEQRPAPETRPLRTEMPQIAGQRLGRAGVTRGNVADSHMAESKSAGATFIAKSTRGIHIVVSQLSNRWRWRLGCERRYCFGAFTVAPRCAAACHGQR